MKNEAKANGGPIHFRSPEELLGLNTVDPLDDREFPEGVTDAPDEASRRDFIKLMSASAALAGVGLTGCRRPVEEIYPFSKQPHDYIHGVPQYFATAMPTRSGAIPLVAKSNDGRPTKVEGNAEFPGGNGATDAFAQASVLGLYDPDRARRYSKDGKNVTKEAVLDLLAGTGAKFAANKGKGLAFLAERNTSPSQALLVAEITAKFPEAIWGEYEAIDADIHRRAASIATGKSVIPRFELGRAKRIVSLDCDFLGNEEDSFRYIGDFAKGRKISGPDKKQKDKLMSRLYVVEALMSQTGANADHRLRLVPSQMLATASLLAQEVLKLSGNGDAQLLASLSKHAGGFTGDSAWVTECARDLVANKGASLVLAGERQPLPVHLIVNAINETLAAAGKTLEYLAVPENKAVGIGEVAAELSAGHVDTLVILGGNPAYNAPADLNWSELHGKASTTIRLGTAEDETSALGGWNVPQAHYLESWGDARTSDGSLVPVQPLIAPLFDGLTTIELLGRLLGDKLASAHDIAKKTFSGLVGGDPLGQKWKKFLHDGFWKDSGHRAVHAPVKAASVAEALAKVQPATPEEGLEIVFHRDYSADDGRYGNNGWMQEMPDPITKMTWDNAVLISRSTAEKNGVKNSEIVDIQLGDRKLTAAVWVQPGQADNTLGLALGYGRARGGRIANFDGKSVGYNAYTLRTSNAANLATGATLRGTRREHQFACAQEHWAMHGRPIIREANLDQYLAKPDFAHHMDLEAHAPDAGPIYKRPYEDKRYGPDVKSDVHQWGMTIDLNSCVGCSACVIACQSENNVPIVGKDQVAKRREMHWLRIDRYFTGDPVKTKKEEKKNFIGTYVDADGDEWKQDWIDDPQVVNQPMFCQHCENAPCESVCPVNATVHDSEGLNVMAYNRCVGTRYCSNNCAWKARRFNWFDYNKRPTEKLYQNLSLSDILSLNFFAKRKEDEIDLLAMAKNPDVTVRMRGVMEKCTFCVQRIEQAKIAKKVAAKDSNDIRVEEGGVKSACQQACPANAIVFGNLLDPDSEVSRLKKDERNYAVLGFLDNNPRVTYLAKVRNPNPAMPGYREYPFSLDEYRSKSGDPLAAHGAADGGHH
ncbi:MAG: Fe-S-cluster-containing hydrogenase [Verrucomicrobiae bacterium]|nr:Fe-S-cluster-containing hydrogenase [Verrucomicrobiae bacterium]